MANYPIQPTGRQFPMNLWLIKEEEFDQFTYTGGKVIYIVEEPAPRYRTHPAIITAGALLPPIDAIQAELNGNIFESTALYDQYLKSQEADMYVSIMIAAGIKRIPIGIMFGKDELEMQFPKMFIDHLYRMYGMVIGVQNQVPSYILEEAMPYDLAKLYCMNIIDYPTFMELHPKLPICDIVLSKMILEVNPYVKDKSLVSYMEYFENAKNRIQDNKGRFLYDPMVAI